MPEGNELWTRLRGFAIGDAGAELSFGRRLARDNAWSAAFSERVIEEYKKFIFLAMEAGHPVTPSDEVDQAWHLHLLYTESYWHDLCRDVLGRPLHHGPTRGGESEGNKYRGWYGATLESYRRLFGEEPPQDIWPPSARRFGLAPYFRRVNTAEHYVISKRGLAQRAKLLCGCSLLLELAGCAAIIAQNRGNGWDWGAIVLVAGVIIAVGVLAILADMQTKRRGRAGRSRRKGLIGGSGCAFAGGAGCGSGDVTGGGASGGGDGGGSGGSGCGGGGCGGGGT